LPMKIHNHLLRSILVAGAAATLAVAQSSTTGSGASGQNASGQNTTGSGSTVGSAGQSGSTTGGGAGHTGTGSGAGNPGTTGSATGNASGASGHQGHVAGAAGNSSSDAAQSMVGKSDQAFMTEAAMGGLAEVQLAQMAQQKASSQEVKDYARRLEQDHTKANDQLKSIAQQRQVSLPSDIGAKHQQMVSKLNSMSGPEFDQAYMKMMVQDHRKDIKAFEHESNRGMDTDLKNFASTTLPTLREHLTMAEQLNNSTRSRKADKSSGTSSSATSGNSGNSGSSSSGSSSSSSSSSTTNPTSK